jgi:hypothetical protein
MFRVLNTRMPRLRRVSKVGLRSGGVVEPRAPHTQDASIIRGEESQIFGYKCIQAPVLLEPLIQDEANTSKVDKL